MLNFFLFIMNIVMLFFSRYLVVITKQNNLINQI